jgi:spore germination cell wall hydrolase CwlJ-like protein
MPEPTEVIPTEPVKQTDPIHIEEEKPVVNKPTTIPTEPATTPETMSDREMLACVIYQEAGGNGSCDNCRRYVADIVLNRVNDPRFPDNIHDVLTAPSQYGRFHWTGVKWADRAKYETEKEAVARAYQVADEVLAGEHSELYGNGYIWQAGFAQGSDGFWCCGHFYGR